MNLLKVARKNTVNEALAEVEDYARLHGYRTRSRKREDVYNRAYLAVYLYSKNFSLVDIASCLGLFGRKGEPDHSTVKYYIETIFANLSNDLDFKVKTYYTAQAFPFKQDQSRELFRERLVLCELDEDSFIKLKIYKTKNRIHRYGDAVKEIIKKHL